MSNQMPVVTFKEATAMAAYFASIDCPMWIWGAPGIGKSQLIRHAAKLAGAIVIDLRLALLDPLDLRGLPSIQNGKTVWLKPDFWPSIAGQLVYLFLDELDRASASVRNAALQLVLDRRIGEHVLPDSVRIFAAGNGATDKGLTQSIGEAMADRFAHVGMRSDLKGWLQYAEKAGYNPHLLSFLEMRASENPAIFHNESPARGSLTNSTPRTWETVNKAIGAPSIIRRKVFAALVGDSISGEFCAFLDMAGKLPPLATFIADPHGAPVYPAGDMAINFALGLALARNADPSNWAAIAAYSQRMPREFHFLTITAAIKRNPELKNSRAYVDFITANPGVFS